MFSKVAFKDAMKFGCLRETQFRSASFSTSASQHRAELIGEEQRPPALGTIGLAMELETKPRIRAEMIENFMIAFPFLEVMW